MFDCPLGFNECRTLVTSQLEKNVFPVIKLNMTPAKHRDIFRHTRFAKKFG